MDLLKSFNWLNWYGGKFSTSQGRGVFMDQALELLPADAWRWYLLANSPEGSDTAFTWEQFATAVNKDLADVLGNFVNRILKFCETRFDGVTPEGGEDGPLEAKLHADLATPHGGADRQLSRPSRSGSRPRRSGPSGCLAMSIWPRPHPGRR